MAEQTREMMGLQRWSVNYCLISHFCKKIEIWAKQIILMYTKAQVLKFIKHSVNKN